MRLFLISFLLLISTEYSWSAPREPPPPPPAPPPTPAPTEPPAGGPLMCYTGKKHYEDGQEISSEQIQKVNCDGACYLNVFKSNDKKWWTVSCVKKGQIYGRAGKCISHGGPHFECYCDTNHCFTIEIAEQAMEQAPEAQKRYDAGGSTAEKGFEKTIAFKELFTISSYGRGSDSASPNTGDVPQETPGGVNHVAYTA